MNFIWTAYRGAPGVFARLCWAKKPLWLLAKLVFIMLISTSIVAAQEFLRKWGSQGAGDGQFNFPIRVAVGHQEVYVADLVNHRIQVFSISVGPQLGSKEAAALGHRRYWRWPVPVSIWYGF